MGKFCFLEKGADLHQCATLRITDNYKTLTQRYYFVND